MAGSSACQRFEVAAAALDLHIDVRRFSQGTRTASEAAAAVGCELGQIVKSLVFLCDGEPVLALTSGSRRVDTDLLGEVLGGTIVRADADAVRRATGYAIGGTPPFGHVRPLTGTRGPAPPRRACSQRELPRMTATRDVGPRPGLGASPAVSQCQA